jgi:phage shock protein C
VNDRLYRSRDDRMLAGVAGGLAEYWDADPSLIRLVWALLVIFTGGIALIVYIVMALILPDGPVTTLSAEAVAVRDTRRAARREARSRGGGRTAGIVFGLLLLLLGTWFLIEELFPALDTDLFWPIGLVILGAALLAMAFRPRSEASAPPVEPPPAPTVAPPVAPPPADTGRTVEPGQPAGAGS